MITDNQAKEAIKTIARYCNQKTSKNGENPCISCFMDPICEETDEPPEIWPEYLEAEE